MTKQQLQESLNAALAFLRDEILAAKDNQLSGVTITILHDEIGPTLIARLRVHGYRVDVMKYKEKSDLDDSPARYTALITW